MLIRTPKLNFIALSFLISVGFMRTSWAQDDDDGGGDDTFAEAEEGEGEDVSEAPEVVDPDAVKHGIGLRLRYIFMPKALIEIFLEEAASGVSRSGFGFDYVRRKKEFEFSVGFEYDTLGPDNGYFVERGGSPTQLGTTDYVEFEDLSWITIDAAFVYHHKLSDMVSLRYGGGIGFGLVRGEVYTTDAQCVGTDAQSDCVPIANAPREKEDFFRYPPVLNVIGGVQLTPADNVAINLEIGMRTVFYSGIGIQYFF